MIVRRYGNLLALVCAALLTATACADVPLRTQPQVISDDEGAATDAGPAVAPPDKDLSAEQTVRKFITANAQAANDYEASRLYLDPKAAREWRPNKDVVIMPDHYNATVPPDTTQPEDPNEAIVRVRGPRLGSLGPDNAFIPGGRPVETEIKLRRQRDDKQWRIVDPPDDVITTEPDFIANYYQVPLYFFAPQSNVRVPDPRFVLAEPKESLPVRVVELLLEGPSNALAKAVSNPLEKATLDTNPTVKPGGLLEVPLTGVAQEDAEKRQLMVAQLVMSLETVSVDRVRPLSDGRTLVAGHQDWRNGDFPSTNATMSADLTGMALKDGRLVSLEDAEPVPGPAGTGAYQVRSAAQSLDGGLLAVVERAGKRAGIRVGPVDGDLASIDLRAGRLTRPTWRPAVAGSKQSNEVWTVVDSKKVARIALAADNVWKAQTVNVSALDGFGPMTALRLSRDGTRAVIVADKKVVVASVVRTSDSVLLRAPRILQPDTLTDVVDVDWLSQEWLVAATSSASRPVVKLPVDGFGYERYSLSNLELPLRGITAAPDRPVVAANPGGLWEASLPSEVWRQRSLSQSSLSSPFYPG